MAGPSRGGLLAQMRVRAGSSVAISPLPLHRTPCGVWLDGHDVGEDTNGPLLELATERALQQTQHPEVTDATQRDRSGHRTAT